MADNNCCCGGKTRLIYACSGASDVGEIADKVARRLRDKGVGNMTCLAAIGANLSGFVESAKGANENIVIDGCPIKCGKNVLQGKGVKKVKSFVLADFGLKKGETPVTKKIVDKISKEIKEKLDK